MGKMKENEVILRRWVDEVWAFGNEDTIYELLDEKVIANPLFRQTREPIYGRENFIKFIRYIRSQFTNIEIAIEQIAADEQKAIAFLNIQGDRRFSSEDGQVSERRVKKSGLLQLMIENGKIIQTWNNLDIFNESE